MDLLPFQVEASGQIAERFGEYMENPLTITRSGPDIIPFYQNLSSITGSGKTLILADTVEQIRSRLPIEPIVLWLSKGRVVVWQTFNNLASGKYADLIGGFDVKPLLECNSADVENSARGLILVATVGKFNQKDKEKGDRKIFQVGLDVASESLWDMLKARTDAQGRRRHFIVIYDEGHNLSNQQTSLLLELGPDALIAASATLRVPDALSRIISRLRGDKSWKDESFVTSVRSSAVVESGLVKKQLLLAGYLTPMEAAVDELVSEMRRVETTAERLGLDFRPKAIYVSKTNAVDGSSIREDTARPFNERLARPILIWRHLVEHGGVDPADVAVYCDLKFDKKLPPPPMFNVFAGGDSDYDNFVAGNYRHIIFNLGLQEGWDDPECCFAYIDKDMGSPDQVTQIVGRVLRQPGAKHYPAMILNTAHFYIRTDERGVFEDIITDVRKKLATDAPEISLIVTKSRRSGVKPICPVLKHREVPTVSINSAAAQEPIRKIVEMVPTYEAGAEGTTGKGGRIQVLQQIGKDSTGKEEWVEVGHSNKVTARWVFLRELQRRHRRAAHLCDVEHPKFDAMIEYNSPASDLLKELAGKVADKYFEHSVIVQNALDVPYVVDSILVDENRPRITFKKALHRAYTELNGLEEEFALALDKTRKDWCRNPSTGGYEIPLLDRGSTRTFNPDFLVWVNTKNIVAIDPKGDHLIVEAAGQKLFHIEPVAQGPMVSIRLVTEGHWEVVNGVPSKRLGKTGYTVWSLKQGKTHPSLCESVASAARTCLKLRT